MSDAPILRRYSFRLYPNKAQTAALTQQAMMCAALWNALLEMRETHFRRAVQRGDRKTTLTAFDQGRDITALRQELPEWAAMPRGTQERVCGDLDLAFKAFFRRARAGEGRRSGYPRYKRVAHATAIPLREPLKSCWTFVRAPSGGAGARDRARTWTFSMRGIPGAIRARGRFPVDPAALKTADLRVVDDHWTLSVCADMPDLRRAHGDKTLTVRFDLIDSFASVTDADGQCMAGPSDPFMTGGEGEIPQIGNGFSERPCGDRANAGDMQEESAALVHHETCGDPANAGDVQGNTKEPSYRKSCGDPANAGDVQEISERTSNASCGDPANEGDVQAAIATSRSCMACGDRANAGDMRVSQQTPLSDAVQSAGDRRFRKFSVRWKREKRRVSRIKAKEARRRREYLHRWTTAIIQRACDLTVVAPIVSHMRTGRGDKRAPGAEVATIASLNRVVREQAPASAVAMLEYKAAHAGVRCDVIRAADHQTMIGGDLRAAAISNRRARRTAKRIERKAA